MSQHKQFHYSITVKTDDEAVLHCLRGLSHFAQKTGNINITWGGTKKSDWEENRNKVKFHFSANGFREVFKTEAKRLLPEETWKIIAERDNDPAEPQV